MLEHPVTSHPLGDGTLILYSTSPTPHEHLILDLAAQLPNRDHDAPIRIAVLQTPLEEPPPETLSSLWEHFGTKSVAIHMEDAGIATRADALLPGVIARIQAADLVLITGGSPERAYRILDQTPALEALASASQAGAVIAGCSAGALLFGQGMLSNESGTLLPFPLWGWLPNWVVAPHYGAYDIQEWQRVFPHCAILGIPNNAMALVQGRLGHIESLGPEPLMILQQRSKGAIVVPEGERWKIEG